MGSPVTNLHLAIFEAARNYLEVESASYEVLAGILSPVHDAYGKESLVSAEHRLAMCRASVAESDWISVAGWEIAQSGWTRTADVLRAYQKAINARKPFSRPVKLMLLCGADLLQSSNAKEPTSDNSSTKMMSFSRVGTTFRAFRCRARTASV